MDVPCNHSKTAHITLIACAHTACKIFCQHRQQLSQIILPVDALFCVCDACCSHDLLIDKYYQDIVNCLINASKKSVPSRLFFTPIFNPNFVKSLSLSIILTLL